MKNYTFKFMLEHTLTLRQNSLNEAEKELKDRLTALGIQSDHLSYAVHIQSVDIE